MNRLQTEFHRLFEAPAATPGPAAVRGLVLALALPDAWERLAPAWAGVQSDCGWPAPAIAVSGTDAFQLWFPLAEPMDAAPALALLEALCRRHLAGVPLHRVRLMATPEAACTVPALLPAPHVPALQTATSEWSAFVAPDLAPLFAQTPWLDMPPGDDGQARLLRGIAPITPAQVATALQALGLATAAEPPAVVQAAAAAVPADTLPAPAPVPEAPPAPAAPHDDPRRFLLSVMNDVAAPLALRIEAAKALLPGPRG